MCVKLKVTTALCSLESSMNLYFCRGRLKSSYDIDEVKLRGKERESALQDQ